MRELSIQKDGNTIKEFEIYCGDSIDVTSDGDYEESFMVGMTLSFGGYEYNVKIPYSEYLRMIKDGVIEWV